MKISLKKKHFNTFFPHFLPSAPVKQQQQFISRFLLGFVILRLSCEIPSFVVNEFVFIFVSKSEVFFWLGPCINDVMSIICYQNSPLTVTSFVTLHIGVKYWGLLPLQAIFFSLFCEFTLFPNVWLDLLIANVSKRITDKFTSSRLFCLKN